MTGGDTTFPPAPPGSGARSMSVIWLVVALCGVFVLALSLWHSAPVAARIGLGSFEQAVVTARTDTEAAPPTRGSCRLYTHYQVRWDSGTGHFGVCTTRARWQVDDTLEIAVAPWSSEVSARSSDLGWHLLALVTGPLMLVHGSRAVRHYHRLTRGGSGAETRGTLSAMSKTHVRITPTPGAVDSRRILLLPAAASLQARVGDPVSIWSSRRGWTGRPRGPWVVVSRGRVSVATHLWRRPVFTAGRGSPG